MCIKDRIEQVKALFRDRFQQEPQWIVQSPGRAEIIGCHTDYNGGFAIGCALPQRIVGAFSPRQDGLFCLFTEHHGEGSDLTEDYSVIRLNPLSTETASPSKYAMGVISEFQQIKPVLTGASLYLTSDIPATGGLSSSAAFEVAIALTLQTLNQVYLTKKELAVLCQRAENGSYVNVPCGILDQATVMLSNVNDLVFFDFGKGSRYTFDSQSVSANVHEAELSFLLTMDPSAQRRLGDTAYSKRRDACEASLPIVSSLLNRDIFSLRDVGIEQFNRIKRDLALQNKEMSKRVEHVVFENSRVLASVSLLKQKNFREFGKMLSQSGASALKLYGLSEGTPELDFLYSESLKERGVLGSRNMGGGFSALILSLVEDRYISSFKRSLGVRYQKCYGRELIFITFRPSGGGAVSNLTAIH